MKIRTNLPNYIEHEPIYFDNLEDFLNHAFWKHYLMCVEEIKFHMNFNFKDWVLNVRFIEGKYFSRIANFTLEEFERIEPIEDYLSYLMLKTEKEIEEYKIKWGTKKNALDAL